MALIPLCACAPSVDGADQPAGRAVTSLSSRSAPIVIAHRGASGYRPEHTLAAYELALLQGADFIEPDLVVTGDGELIARHENALAAVALDGDRIRYDEAGAVEVLWETTDVAQKAEFRDRLTVKRIDGRFVGGWFSEDFSLAEIKSLFSRERIPRIRPGNRLHNDLYRIPSLKEIIELVKAHEAGSGAAAGLYLETKHPTYFALEGRFLGGKLINLDLNTLLLDTLQEETFTSPERLYIQSFEVANLLSLRAMMSDRGLGVPLIQLFGDVLNSRYFAQPYDMVYHVREGTDLDDIYPGFGSRLRSGIHERISYAELAQPDVLAFMADTYASGIGPTKQNVLLTESADPMDPDGDGRMLQAAAISGEIGQLVGHADDAGLEIHVYTLRAEEPFLVRDGTRTLTVHEEGVRLLEAGVDGFFTDHPAEGRSSVAAFLDGRHRADSNAANP